MVVGIIGAGVFFLGRDKEPKNTLPVVTEPTPTVNPTPDIDYSKIDLPKSDNEGEDNLITEEIPEMTEEEIEAVLEYEKENPVPVMTPEEIAEQNKAIEDAKREAEANSDTQPVISQPVETPPAGTRPTQKPPKDADGFRYTKEEAISNFATEYQKYIDANSTSYRLALELSLENGFTQEDFEANLHQLMTDPYSSPIMASSFNEYRRTGLIDGLIYAAASWLANGGDKGEWFETVVQ